MEKRKQKSAEHKRLLELQTVTRTTCRIKNEELRVKNEE
jgi:hypothetical protein